MNEVLTLIAIVLSCSRRISTGTSPPTFEYLGSPTMEDITVRVRRSTVVNRSLDERHEDFRNVFRRNIGPFGSVISDSFEISGTRNRYFVKAKVMVNEIRTCETTVDIRSVDIRSPRLGFNDILHLVTEEFRMQHGAPLGNIEIAMTHTHHTMRADIREVATMVFRMVVLVTDGDNVIDYEIVESYDERANVGSRDDADSSGNDAAESSGDDISISEDEDSQPRGPCSMCGAIGISGQKCETGPDCDSDTGGVYA